MHPLMHRLSFCFPLTKSFLRFHNTLNGMEKYDRVSDREEFEKLLNRRWEAISMAEKIKVAFICVHNSCRSQMAEALGKKHLADICDCYSAGTQTKPQINQDAVRLMKKVHGIDMEESQHSKLFEDIPETDIVVAMGCNVVCPYVHNKLNLNWGLEDPTGQSDDKFLEVMALIEENILELRKTVLEMQEQ